jgi:hypothetical protein
MRDCLETYLIISLLCSIVYVCISYLRGQTDPDHDADPPAIDPATIERINAAIARPGYCGVDVRWNEHR